MLLLYASGYTNYLSTLLRTVQFAIQLSAHSFTIITAILFNIFIIDIVWNSQNTYSYSLRDILYKSRQRKLSSGFCGIHLACRQILQQWFFPNTGHRYVQAHHSQSSYLTVLPEQCDTNILLKNLNVTSFLHFFYFHLSKNYCNVDLKQQPKSVIKTFLKL